VELALRDTRPQWWLDQHEAAPLLTSPHGWIGADDDIPFHLSWLAQGSLRALIGVIEQARVAHAQEVAIFRLSLHGIPRQGMFPVLQRQHILEDVDERLVAHQSLFPIEQEIAEPGIACLRQRSRLADPALAACL
jgi:hypothetical protein